MAQQETWVVMWRLVPRTDMGWATGRWEVTQHVFSSRDDALIYMCENKAEFGNCEWAIAKVERVE